MGMPSTTAITVLSRNYLHFAANLHRSLRASNPDLTLVVYLLDEYPSDFQHPASTARLVHDEELSFFIVPVGDLGISNWDRMTFQYTPFELSCAIKPFATRHALQNFADLVIYCDSDLQFYDSVDGIIQRLEQHSILLTPHFADLTGMQSVAAKARGQAFHGIRQSGVFNAGFYAVSQSPATQEFLNWWCERCEQDCYINLSSSVFVDQAWLDLVPALFDEVFIERSPQYNVAYWNIAQRSLTTNAAGQWVVGKDRAPLCFFHFSGFDLNQPTELSKHHPLFPFNASDYQSLTSEYAQQVQAFVPEVYQELGCQYATWPDGGPVPAYWRELIRCNASPFDEIRNPWTIIDQPELCQQMHKAEGLAIAQRLSWQIEDLDRRYHELATRKPRWRRWIKKVLGK